MPKPLKTARIGIYECQIVNDYVTKKKPVCYYYGLFTWDLLHAKILPDLQEKKRVGRPFSFPLLVVSYYLGKGHPSPRPTGALNLSSGSVISMRKALGLPTRREKIARTEMWQAVVEQSGKITKIDKNKLVNDY